jgi:PAS domain S-box-containing protein
MRPLNILYLEDNPLDVELTRSRLEAEGLDHRMSHARTRPEFLAALEKGGFDVLMIDYSVPGFASLEALDIARSRFPEAPIIIISGTIGEEIAIDTMRHGANDYVLKNRISRLSPTIRRAHQEAEDRRRRETAERAHREAEARYRTLFEASPEAVFLIDGEGIILDCNPEGGRLLGVSPADLVGRHCATTGFLARFCGGSDAAAGGEGLDARPASSEESISADGGTRWVEIIPGRMTVNGARGMQVIVREITERKRADERIQNSLREKEVLLREIHHRVKNNLQIIYGLLTFKGGETGGESQRGICRDCRNRIYTMALVHERLTQSDDLARIRFRDSAHRLVSEMVLSSARPHRIAYDLDVEDVTFTLSVAVPLALILNELVNRALQRAFPDGRSGNLRIGLHPSEPGWFDMTFRHDGVGGTGSSGTEEDRDLGMRLVRMLVEQIHGVLTVSGDAESSFRIRFPRASEPADGSNGAVPPQSDRHGT